MTSPSSSALSRPRSWAPWIALFLVALALRCWGIGQPAEVAFDESLVGRFFSAYFSGVYYFDIHPPHLKLFYAFLAWLGGMPPSYNFPGPETPYPSDFYVLLRLFPALCGAALSVVVAALAREAGAARLWALAAGWAVALDSALIVESRFILNDIPLLFFGCAGWLCLARWRSRRGAWRLALGALCLAIAASIKWTGLAFMAPVLALLAYDFVASSWRRPAIAAAVIVAVALLWQGAGYFLHFQLLPRVAGEHVHLSPETRNGVFGPRRAQTPSGKAMAIARAAWELNGDMAEAANRVGPHPYSSRWISWPAGWRGIYFWNDRAPSEASRVYMLPNLAVWWAGAFGAAYLLLNLAPRLVARLARRKSRPVAPVELLLASCFLINWLPFAFINRPMFLYHYFPALIVSLLICARAASAIERPRPFAFAWVGLCLAFLLWMAPLVYGAPLSESALAARMLLSSWP